MAGHRASPFYKSNTAGRFYFDFVGPIVSPRPSDFFGPIEAGLILSDFCPIPSPRPSDFFDPIEAGLNLSV